MNKSFSGKRNIENDIFAYIDESGTDCLTKVEKSEKWFVVSSIVLCFNESTRMLEAVDNFRISHRKNTPLDKLTFKKIRKHNQRKDLLASLCKFNYLTIHSAFYKDKIDPDFYSYPSMYFVCIKNVIERLSWLAAQFFKKRVHILISKRNQIRKMDLSKYLFEYSIIGKRNLMYLDRIGQVSFGQINKQPKLLLADYTASAMRCCLEKTTAAEITENTYFDIFLKGKLYSSNHPTYNGVWRNGFKCTPDDKNLLGYNGILEEGPHKL